MSDIIISDNYTRAYSLDKKIKANAQILQDTIFELGKSLLEMRDGKLYKELGYQNFAEYCENEVGIKKSQAYNYITIVDRLSEDFVHSSGQIGVKKLYLLSQLDEVTRNEIIQNTDVSGTSVKELEKQIRELKGENDKLRQAEEKYIEEVGKVKKELADAEEENNLLSGQIYELENQPRDVVIATEESREIRNMEKAMEKLNIEFSERYDKLQDENEKYVRNINKQHTEELKRIQEEHNAELAAVRSEYDQKITDIQEQQTSGTADTKEIFKAYFSNATDSLNRLMDFIENHSEDNNIPFYLSKADGIINIFNKRRNLLSEKEQ